MIKCWALFLVLFLFARPAFCQNSGYFIDRPLYPFIRYSQDSLFISPDNKEFTRLFEKFDSLVLFGKGKINIVHIGGSHIQADMYTHEIRKKLQQLQPDMNGGRGFIFPFSVARTNNPSNYRVSWKGNWEACKNVQYKRDCPLGLSGMSVTTSDKYASISINPNNDPDITYSFNAVRVFHNPTRYNIIIETNGENYEGLYDSIGGYSLFEVPDSWSLKIKVELPDSISDKISIYGVSLDNDNSGIVYNAIGVNGARLSSYIKCEYYSQHLAAINPDLIIFSIGTNDANTRVFNQGLYETEYEQLIEISKMAAPNAVILITVPNDCYFLKRYPNKNTAIMRDVIYALAKGHHYGVWDFYSVMGGFNSSQTWYNYGLMRYDRIHFNKAGYKIKGDLLLAAFLEAWEKNLPARTAPLIYPHHTNLNLTSANPEEIK